VTLKPSMSDLLSNHELTNLIESFSSQRLVVIGDVMLDRFIWGSVQRISPEAPVPVVQVESEDFYPGGAANVARNITPFGAKVELIGLVGPDENGGLLRDTLEVNQIGVDHLQEIEGFSTITKTRIVARQQQVVRIDRERKISPTSEQIAEVVRQLTEMAPGLDGVIIEDYGKGFVTQELVDAVIAIANDADLTITVDPNPTNPLRWKNVHAVKPNRVEAFAEVGLTDPHDGADPLTDPALAEVGERLLKKWDSDHLLVTLGEQGMMLFSENDDPFHIPTRAKEVFDVSGAGDTAIAVFTLALCAGAAPKVAAELSNEASGIVVGKLGTAQVTREEMLEKHQD